MYQHIIFKGTTYSITNIYYSIYQHKISNFQNFVTNILGSQPNFGTKRLGQTFCRVKEGQILGGVKKMLTNILGAQLFGGCLYRTKCVRYGKLRIPFGICNIFFMPIPQNYWIFQSNQETA